jgi:hypothetical protein
MSCLMDDPDGTYSLCSCQRRSRQAPLPRPHGPPRTRDAAASDRRCLLRCEWFDGPCRRDVRCAFTSAPCTTSSFATSACPSWHARCSGVHRSLSFATVSGAMYNVNGTYSLRLHHRRSLQSPLPLPHVRFGTQNAAVSTRCCLIRCRRFDRSCRWDIRCAFTSAPCKTSCCATSACPFSHTRCSGTCPSSAFTM